MKMSSSSSTKSNNLGCGGLIGFPTLIAGLILRYADNPPWFHGAHEVGHILILVSLAAFAIGLIFLLVAIAFVAFVGTK